MAVVSAVENFDKTNIDNMCNDRVSLFNMLKRGLCHTYINEHVTNIYNRKILDEMRDLFVMAFQTRDVRGGKGERRLFYNFISALYEHDKDGIHKILHLIPEYGCWRDMWELITYIPELEKYIMAITKKVFLEDLFKYHSNMKQTMSLLAKWLPREKSGMYPGMASKLAKYIYGADETEQKRLVRYRKETSMMNKALKTVEINMCDRNWTEIKPTTVPARCLEIHSKAFLNESIYDMDYDLRYPNSNDRMECRRHFQEFTENLKNAREHVVQALPCYSFKDKMDMQGMRTVLDVERYDAVRNAWNESH